MPLRRLQCVVAARHDDVFWQVATLDPEHTTASARSGFSGGVRLSFGERCVARVCREAGPVHLQHPSGRHELTSRPNRSRCQQPAACRGLPCPEALRKKARKNNDNKMASSLLSTPPWCRPCLARECPTGPAAGTQAQRWAAKEQAYSELLRSARCRLVVLAVEVGGRWSKEAASFVRAGKRLRGSGPL